MSGPGQDARRRGKGLQRVCQLGRPRTGGEGAAATGFFVDDARVIALRLPNFCAGDHVVPRDWAVAVTLLNEQRLAPVLQ